MRLPPTARTTPRGPRARSCTLGAVAAILVLTASPAALADTPSAPAPASADLVAARALFAAGVADERAGRWADALVKIRRASAVKLTPGIRFHLALCDEQLGHLTVAFAEYTAAQTAAQAEKNQEVLDLVTEPLRELKVRTPTVTVNLPKRFMVGGSGAEVRLDGATLPASSFATAVPVDVGSHTIQATAPGQVPYAMTLTVVERQAATLDIQFLPTGAPVPSGVVAPTAPVAEAGATPPSTAAPAPSAVESPSSARPHTLAIIATASAIGLVAAGVGAFAIAGSDQSYYDGLCANKGPGCGNATAVRGWDGAALGAWIAGAGVGVVAVVLWTKPTKQDSGHAELRAGPGSLLLQGTF